MKRIENLVGDLCDILAKGVLVLCLLIFVLPVSGQTQPYELRPLKGKSLEGTINPIEKRGVWGYADERGAEAVCFRFSGDREAVRRQTAREALKLATTKTKSTLCNK